MGTTEEFYCQAIRQDSDTFARLAAKLGFCRDTGVAGLLEALRQCPPARLELLAQDAEEEGWGYDEFGNPGPVLHLLALYLPHLYVL